MKVAYKNKIKYFGMLLSGKYVRKNLNIRKFSFSFIQLYGATLLHWSH